MRSLFLYFADDRLSQAELSAARLDGDVVELGDAYIPADAVETSALRAGSLAQLLGDALAATHLSAAWIHGATHFPPARHTVQRAVPRRLRTEPEHQVVYRDLQVPADDLLLLGGVRVTSPARTLVDLARTPDHEHEAAARRLAASCPGALQAALDRLERGALPHKRRALGFLRELADAGQFDVTR
jgi:hypothetical protein